MFYHIFYPLRSFFSPLNVFGYITFRSMMAILTSLILSFIIGGKLISYFKRTQIIQTIRPDGPATHQKKAGTPTMGGVIILLTLLVSTLLWARLDNRFVIWTIISVIWLGFLGFLDDYLKVIKKNPEGIKARTKLLGQIILALSVSVYLYFNPSNPQFSTIINLPYFKDAYIDIGIFYIVFSTLVIVGSSNAVNLTDGLDGLAIGNIIIAAFSYVIFSYIAGHAKFSQYLKIIPVPGAGELSIFLSAMIGAGLGFLWFNGYPAEIFMGDTGSLFLGGTIGLIAVFIKQELILIVVGGIFVIEVLSVIIQVSYFKRTKRRVFKMSPIHHHFELSGWAEPKVTIRFWIVSIVLSLIAMTSLKLR